MADKPIIILIDADELKRRLSSISESLESIKIPDPNEMIAGHIRAIIESKQEDKNRDALD